MNVNFSQLYNIWKLTKQNKRSLPFSKFHRSHWVSIFSESGLLRSISKENVFFYDMENYRKNLHDRFLLQGRLIIQFASLTQTKSWILHGVHCLWTNTIDTLHREKIWFFFVIRIDYTFPYIFIFLFWNVFFCAFFQTSFQNLWICIFEILCACVVILRLLILLYLLKKHIELYCLHIFNTCLFKRR